MALYKHNVGLLAALRKPVVKSLAPLCMTCGRYLDSESVVETQGTRIRILGRHHGAEEAVWFDMGSVEWDESDFERVMRGHNWFDPRLVEK